MNAQLGLFTIPEHLSEVSVFYSAGGHWWRLWRIVPERVL